eukprot:4120396-Amphidinium_carterae.1
MMQVALEDLHIASDSDVLDDDDPTKTWVQTLKDEHGVAYQTCGRKRCKICRRQDGLMRRCNNCRHHGSQLWNEGPRGRVAVTAAEIQGALQRQGTLQPGDTFSEACLAPAQVVGRGFTPNSSSFALSTL